MSTESAIESGRVVLHYRVGESLGRGGMGEVFTAHDTKLDRDVALKVLPPELAADAERLDRFKREARALAALDHPGIVTIHSVEEIDGLYFLTMGLVKGGSLEELIPTGGMPLGELLDIALPLTEALASAHAKGITHRDLKPSNVMVTDEGRVKVLDFGLAKSAFAAEDGGQELPTEALTAEGRILGTVAYMSPEQAEGRPVDPRSDVFSLGVLLYEMTTGQRPFQADSTIGTLSAVLQANPRPVAELKPDAPTKLASIIQRCLERDPTARYRNASELHGDLREFQESLSSPSAGLAAGASTSARASRGGRLWLVAAVIVVVTAVAIWFLSSSRGPEPQELSTEAGSSQAVSRPMVAVLPFQNLGSSEDEYFAIGMTEEIASRMASVRSIGVIATSSTRQYANTQKTAQEIGDELGAGYLVTGSVLWARSDDGTSRIRITPQLVSTADETQVWAQSYDRVLDDIFAIQTEIATQVVSRLGISLADTEKAAVAQLPTDNLEAYDAYLRTLAMPFDGADPSSYLTRIEKLSRVVELDPDFALAWFALAANHNGLYTFRFDASEERRQLALEAAQRVEAAAPGSSLAAQVMGHYYYRVERDYDRAVEELARAIELNPNSSWAYWQHGSALRRRADFEAAVESYEASVALDPRQANSFTQLGIALQYLRRYERAIEAYDRSLALEEDRETAHRGKVETFWSWASRLQAARRALEAFPLQSSPAIRDHLWFWQAVYERDFSAAVDSMEKTREEWLGMTIRSRPKELLVGLGRLWLGETDLARQDLEAAVAKLEARLVDTPDNEKLLSSLGVALAALGRREEAIEAALRATEIVPLATDPWFAQVHIEDLAWVYTLLGDDEAALEQLEILLERPSRLTIAYLKLDPRWAPLWDHPGFMELAERYGQEH